MADLKIRVFKGREAAPETTVTVPGSVLKIASNFIPRQAMAALQEKGIELREIIKLAENPEARATPGDGPLLRVRMDDAATGRTGFQAAAL